MDTENKVNDIPMTAAEIAFLWNTYLLNSKAKHILMYGVTQCTDVEIRSVMHLALDLSAKSLSDVREVFDRENQQVPYGFTEEDVYVNAPKVYSDKLMLYILKVYTTVGLANYGSAISSTPQEDIRQLFISGIISTVDLSNKIDNVALKKGIYLATPVIPTTNKTEFAKSKKIMGSFLGHKRSLTALEITSIFNCSMINLISEAQILGMAQTIEDNKLKEFLNRTRKTLKEQSDKLNEILHMENLNFPQTLESEVLNTSIPTFSDRLAFFFCFTTLADILATFSIGMIGVMRKDILIVLTELKSEILVLIKDATDLMLKREWFEEMPKNIDRDDIIHN
jgi:hypothetical protein